MRTIQLSEEMYAVLADAIDDAIGYREPDTYECGWCEFDSQDTLVVMCEDHTNDLKRSQAYQQLQEALDAQEKQRFPQTEDEARVCVHGNRVWFGNECGLCDAAGHYVWKAEE